jgi:hypothetical protein
MGRNSTRSGSWGEGGGADRSSPGFERSQTSQGLPSLSAPFPGTRYLTCANIIRVLLRADQTWRPLQSETSTRIKPSTSHTVQPYGIAPSRSVLQRISVSHTDCQHARCIPYKSQLLFASMLSLLHAPGMDDHHELLCLPEAVLLAMVSSGSYTHS